jgi:hypothetical protein
VVWTVLTLGAIATALARRRRRLAELWRALPADLPAALLGALGIAVAGAIIAPRPELMLPLVMPLATVTALSVLAWLGSSSGSARNAASVIVVAVAALLSTVSSPFPAYPVPQLPLRDGIALVRRAHPTLSEGSDIFAVWGFAIPSLAGRPDLRGRGPSLTSAAAGTENLDELEGRPPQYVILHPELTTTLPAFNGALGDFVVRHSYHLIDLSPRCLLYRHP